jgi:hypothetical protein
VASLPTAPKPLILNPAGMPFPTQTAGSYMPTKPGLITPRTDSWVVDRAGADYACGGTRQGTLMRHFLRPAAAPGTLACRVPAPSTVAALVAHAGPAQRLAPALLCSTPARSSSCPDRRHGRCAPAAHSTHSCTAGSCPASPPCPRLAHAPLDNAVLCWHKGGANVQLPSARAPQKARGSFQECARPSPLRRCAISIAHRARGLSWAPASTASLTSFRGLLDSVTPRRSTNPNRACDPHRGNERLDILRCADPQNQADLRPR